MKSFAQRRAERVAELQASRAYDANAPRPLVRPVSRLPTPPPAPTVPSRKPSPVELLTVSRNVLLFCLDALQAEHAPPTNRRVAANMLRRELGGD